MPEMGQAAAWSPDRLDHVPPPPPPALYLPATWRASSASIALGSIVHLCLPVPAVARLVWPASWLAGASGRLDHVPRSAPLPLPVTWMAGPAAAGLGLNCTAWAAGPQLTHVLGMKYKA